VWDEGIPQFKLKKGSKLLTIAVYDSESIKGAPKL